MSSNIASSLSPSLLSFWDSAYMLTCSLCLPCVLTVLCISFYPFSSVSRSLGNFFCCLSHFTNSLFICVQHAMKFIHYYISIVVFSALEVVIWFYFSTVISLCLAFCCLKIVLIWSFLFWGIMFIAVLWSRSQFQPHLWPSPPAFWPSLAWEAVSVAPWWRFLHKGGRNWGLFAKIEAHQEVFSHDFKQLLWWH